jgi:tripartite-type tricarboxylate transporter receptor subunit TctC
MGMKSRFNGGLRALSVAVLALSLSAEIVSAQGFPNRPIRLYQGFPAGGTADVIARALGSEISKTLGQPVVVEAKPGASGNIATEQVVRSSPDGHSIVLFTTAHLISPALMKSISFDATEDLDYVTMLAELSFFVAVHNDSPFKSINDLIEFARKNPDKLTWGSAGTGSGQHMCGELMAHTANVKVRMYHFAAMRGRLRRCCRRVWISSLRRARSWSVTFKAATSAYSRSQPKSAHQRFPTYRL